MPDPRLVKWAQVLIHHSVGIEPGQTVVIVGGMAAAPLMREVHREALLAGAFPTVIAGIDGVSRDRLLFGNQDKVGYVNPIEMFVAGEADAFINVMADTNTRRSASVDPERSGYVSDDRATMFQTFMRREAEGRLNWTFTHFPTDAYAQEAAMDTDEYADFVLRACKLDQADAIASWRDLGQQHQRLIGWLDGAREVHIKAQDVDLTLSVAGRSWISADGKRNLPDGEIFTGPVETSVNGHIRFSFPVMAGGREINDVQLTFVDGRVAEATASTNEPYLHTALDTDDGSRYLGELAFGTNTDIDRFTGNLILDEKIAGTLHLAIGNGYPETGSTNQSSEHLDMVLDLRSGGHVTVDGKPFLKDGQFLV